MELVHSKLSKGQRGVCAYLNTREIPIGFRGKPIVLEGKKIENHPTHYHLSRVAYALTALLNGVGRLASIKTADDDTPFLVPEMKIDMGIIHTMKGFLGAHLIDGIKDEQRKTIENALAGLARADEQLINLANSYQLLVFEVVRRSGFIVAVQLAMPHREDETIESIRRFGTTSNTIQILRNIVHNIKDQKDPERDSHKIATLELLDGFLVAMMLLELEASVEMNNSTNGLGRALFKKPDKQALAFLRNRIFSEPNVELVWDALRMSSRFWPVEGAELKALLQLHVKYGFRDEAMLDQTPFLVEASPFAEKYIADPIGDIDVVAYPQGEQVRAALRAVRDYTFEHADGSMAFASLTMHDSGFVLQEMQTDVIDLIRRKNGTADEVSGVIEPYIERWPEIIMDAVKLFARRHGFSEFYAVTPFKIFARYCGLFHPDKARTYFDTMERLGGELVFDDTNLLDRKLNLYYYRFKA